MKTEAQIRKLLKEVETKMDKQIERGMEKGWPVFCWDKSCVQRDLLRQILGLKRKQ